MHVAISYILVAPSLPDRAIESASTVRCCSGFDSVIAQVYIKNTAPTTTMMPMSIVESSLSGYVVPAIYEPNFQSLDKLGVAMRDLNGLFE
jgi:hypothetical protein